MRITLMPYDLARSHIVKVPILSTIHANEAIARSLSTETALSSAGTSTVPTAAQKDRLLKLRFRRKTAMLLQPPLKQQRPRGAWSGVGGRAAAARGNRRMLQLPLWIISPCSTVAVACHASPAATALHHLFKPIQTMAAVAARRAIVNERQSRGLSC